MNDSTLNALLNGHVRKDDLTSSSSSILPALTSLDISGNFITNFSILSISDTLNGLQSLNVSGNRPSRDSFIVFCSKQVLYSNKFIHMNPCIYIYIFINVDLYSVSYALHVMIWLISQVHAQALTTVEVSVDGLLAKATSLRVLNLSCCLLDETMTKALFNMLFREWALSVPAGEFRGAFKLHIYTYTRTFCENHIKVVKLCTFYRLLLRFDLDGYPFTIECIATHNNPHTE